MANRLSFAIAINLLTENFKKGTNQVKTALKSMQMQVLTFAAALGAGGLGLSNFVTRLIDVARETSRVTTALKNVSVSTSQFAENQKFLLDMSSKYGLEINALTGNFAKFTASASIANMGMDQQKKIFESVSRACTAFGMSADDSNSVFLALSQMMSKGKISSEELRLQMGERLPIALQAMAKAAGVSVGGLDKLMKQGKVMSADVLPRFADALNEMIPNVDTDNIETSVNRLKNTFTEFTKGTGIQGAYKSLVDGLNSLLKAFSGEMNNVFIGIVAVIAFAATKGIMNLAVSLNKVRGGLEAAALRSNTKLIAATQAKVAAEIALEEAKVAVNNASDSKKLAAKQKLVQAERTLVVASAVEAGELEAVKNAELKLLDAKRISDVRAKEIALANASRQRIATEIELEQAKNAVTIAKDTEIIAAQTRQANAEKELAKKTAKYVAAQEDHKAAAAQAASVKTASVYSTAWTNIKVGAVKVKVAITSMWSAFAPALMVSGLIAAGFKLYEIYKEAQRIKNMFSEYKKEAERVTHTTEITQLKVIQNLYNKAAKGSELKEKYQNRIIELLGGELKKNQDINDAVKERIKLLEATAKVDFHTRGKIENEDSLRKLYGKYGGEDQFNNEYNSKLKEYNESIFWVGSLPDIFSDFDQAVQLRKEIDYAASELDKYLEYQIKNTPTNTPPDLDDDKKKKKTDLEKAEEEYSKESTKLINEKSNGIIKEKEYHHLLDQLNVETNKKLSGLLTPEEAKNNKTFQQVKSSLPYNTKTFDEEYKYQGELDKLGRSRANNYITEKEYNDELRKLTSSTLEACSSMDDLTFGDMVFIATLQYAQKKLKEKVVIPTEEKYDNTFDYKKTKPEIISDKKSSKEKYVGELKSAAGKDADSLAEDIKKGTLNLEQLKAKYKDLSADIVEKLNNAMSNVKSLDEALNIAKVQEDIKNLSKEIDKGIYASVKDAVSIADNLYSSIKNVKEVMESSDSTEWDKFIAVWNAIISTTDGILSAIESIQQLIKMVDTLTGAKVKEQQLEKEAAANKLINSGIAITTNEVEKSSTEGLTSAKEQEIMTDTLAANTKVTNAAIGIGADLTAAGVKKVTAQGEVAANTTVAASEAGKSAAKLPFPMNLIAIAGAIAGVIGIFASLPKFANGGIVSGSSISGDKVLARVNSGEMILNMGQQSKLLNMANNGTAGVSSPKNISVSGDIRIKGSDLYLALKNYKSINRKKL